MFARRLPTLCRLPIVLGAWPGFSERKWNFSPMSSCSLSYRLQGGGVKPDYTGAGAGAGAGVNGRKLWQMRPSWEDHSPETPDLSSFSQASMTVLMFLVLCSSSFLTTPLTEVRWEVLSTNRSVSSHATSLWRVVCVEGCRC